MSYYNTTNEKGETLKENVTKAKSQDDRILAHFKKHSEFYKSRSLGEFTTTSSRLYQFLFL